MKELVFEYGFEEKNIHTLVNPAWQQLADTIVDLQIKCQAKEKCDPNYKIFALFLFAGHGYMVDGLH